MKIEIESEALDTLKAMVQRLQDERDELLVAIKVLADVRVEAFGNKNNPTYPIMGWNDHYIRVSHVLRARAIIDKCTKEPEVM